MLYEIMKYCKNFFADEFHEGLYSIVSGTISLPFAKVGQYILIEGSTFNDGVFKYGDSAMVDEEFEGIITSLRIPADFIKLVSEIEKWQASNADAVNSPYKSESFGGYSYAKPEKGVCWQNQFADRLKIWRKI